MKSCLSSIRWVISLFLGILLVAVITVGIPLASVAKVITNPQNVKTWLYEGGVYEKAANIIFEMTTANAQDKFSQEVNLEEEEELLTSVEDLMPPDWIKFNVENVIDSLYTWLEGETEYPEFEIDLSDRRVLIIDELTKAITNQIESLPECSQEEAKAMEGKNPLELTCFPPDFDTNVINEKMEEEFAKQDFLQEDKISSKDIFEENKNAKEGLEGINKIVRLNYPIIKKLDVYVFAIIIILSIVLFIAVPGLAASFLFTGISWVVAGASLIFGNAVARSRLLTYLEEEAKKMEGGNDLIELFRRPMELASSDIQSQITQYATVIAVLGLVFTIGGIILKFSKKRYYVEEDEKPVSNKTQPDVRLK